MDRKDLIVPSGLMAVGLVITYVSYVLDSRTLKTVLQLVSPTQTNVYLQVSNPFFAALIFVGGALFSAGLPILASFLRDDKNELRTQLEELKKELAKVPKH